MGVTVDDGREAPVVSSMASPLRAVFFDRDGVLNEPVWNGATGEFESPHRLADVMLCDGAPEALRRLSDAGYLLFIVSNQPSYAKGKISLQELQAIGTSVEQRLRATGTQIRQSYYCYHHPHALVPDLSGPCRCRKPEPFFLFEAAGSHAVDLARSWMVGDRDSDIVCGQRAGCRTILVTHPRSRAQRGLSQPNFVAGTIGEAAELILADSCPLAAIGTPSQGGTHGTTP